MTFEIKNRWTGAVVFSGEFDSLFACLNAAIAAGADLSCADLSCANLRSANLRSADLSGANLSGANLRSANLSCADLSCADLSCANLRSANLRSADLSGANLSGANLSGANLRSANLSCAALSGADLSCAYLSGAKNAELAIACTRILPEGDLIGWKMCSGGVLVKLRIPAEAKRSQAFGRKCRAEYVDVLEVIGANVAHTDNHGPRTTYKAGERVVPDRFDDDWTNECSHGIHFFITRAEAEAY